jgi:hypothetical protein
MGYADLRSAEDIETWLTAPAPEALKQPLPDKSLRIVAIGEKRMASLLNSLFAVALAASARMSPDRRKCRVIPERNGRMQRSDTSVRKVGGDSDSCIRSNL